MFMLISKRFAHPDRLGHCVILIGKARTARDPPLRGGTIASVQNIDTIPKARYMAINISG
jgi:hypothetical protein